MEFSKKLRQLIDSHYGSIGNAASDLDVNYTQMSHYLNGRKPSIDLLNKLILKFPELDLNWLLKEELTLKDVVSEDAENYKTPLNEGDLIAKIEVLLHELKSKVSQK